MGCELPTIKYSLFLFNTISAILGIGTIVVSSLALKNYQNEGRSICIGVILLGSIVFLISFFGCCGAIRENVFLTWTQSAWLTNLYSNNSKMLVLFIQIFSTKRLFVIWKAFFGLTSIQHFACIMEKYASFLLILIIGNSVVIFKYLSQLDGETKAIRDINSSWAFELQGKDGMSDIQTVFKCCGKNNSTDYINANLTIPESCFVGGDHNKSTIVFSEGCLVKLIAVFEAAEHWITIFIWSSFSLEMIAFISASVLAITFTNQKRRARY